MTQSTDATDALGEILHHLQLTGAFYCRSEFTRPWGLEIPAFEGCLMLHAVTSGSCWVETKGNEPRRLEAGDLALLPHGKGHRLVDEPGSPAPALFDLPRQLVSSCYETLDHGGGGARTRMLCCVVESEHPAARQLLGYLPDLVLVDGWRIPEAEWLQSTLRFIATEASQLRPGGETIITRLGDVLVIQALRAWLASAPAAREGWLGALRDAQLAPALAAIHRDPEEPWTVAGLAEACAMSRSAFAARFAELVGETPKRYLTRWRMHHATTLLRQGDASVADIAHRLDYHSEAAFSRAYKRVTGSSPGAVRRGAATSAS